MALVRQAAESPPPRNRRVLGRDTESLLATLATGNAEQRRWAAVDLWGVAVAIPGLLEARAVETDPIVAEAILTALTSHDCPQVGRALGADLRSDDATVRNAAVTALHSLPIAVEALVAEGILTDPDADVRILAVMVLSVVSHPGVPQWLRPLIEADPDANVVAAAVDVAVTIASDLAAEFAELAAARFPENPYLRFLAAQAGCR